MGFDAVVKSVNGFGFAATGVSVLSKLMTGVVFVTGRDIIGFSDSFFLTGSSCVFSALVSFRVVNGVNENDEVDGGLAPDPNVNVGATDGVKFSVVVVDGNVGAAAGAVNVDDPLNIEIGVS